MRILAIIFVALVISLALAIFNITVIVNGTSTSIPAIVENNTVFLSARPFLASLGASMAGLGVNKVSVKRCEKITTLDFVLRERQPFLDGVVSARALGFQASFNGTTLEIMGKPCEAASAPAQPVLSIGYDVNFTSTLEIKDDTGGYTSVIDGKGTLTSARAGETLLIKGEPGIPHDSTFTILAEGSIALKYSSISMTSDKCSIQGVDGSAYVMILLGKSASGKPLTVLGLDTGFADSGGRGVAPQEIVTCPGAKPVYLKVWHSVFNKAAQEYLGVVLAPNDQPRPSLLSIGLTLRDQSLYIGYPNGEAGKAVIRGLTTLQLTPHK
jgi:hypothetical protein